jgi:hypothetical protein
LRRENIDTIELGAAFLASAAAVTGSVLVAVAVLLTALRPIATKLAPADPAATRS